jgi:hypothetical protein
MRFWHPLLPYLPFLVLAATGAVAAHHVHSTW